VDRLLFFFVFLFGVVGGAQDRDARRRWHEFATIQFVIVEKKCQADGRDQATGSLSGFAGSESFAEMPAVGPKAKSGPAPKMSCY
jgi:hypothetical protein